MWPVASSITHRCIQSHNRKWESTVLLLLLAVLTAAALIRMR
jgi:hypothetical protein